MKARIRRHLRFLKRLRRPTADEAIDDARRAMIRGNHGRAVRIMRRTVRRHPNHVNAWFAYGLALAAASSFEQVIQDLEPVADWQGDPQPGVAFLLGLAHYKLGLENEAGKWLTVASRSPGFRAKILETEELGRVLKSYEKRRR